MPDPAVLERSCALDPATLSAREARRFVRRLLLDAGRPEWLDAAELAVSEIVTNVVLHAHTRFDLTARLAEDHLRVDVWDGNPVLPRQRQYGGEAVTGRGLALVEQVTDAYGVLPMGAQGKVVWFRIGSPGGGPPARRATGDAADRTGGSVAVPVRLAGLPLQLWSAARVHHDGLLRELALYRVEHPTDVTEEDLVRAHAARTLLAAAVDAQLPGDRRGQAPPGRLDVVVDVSPRSAAAFEALHRTLGAAERLAAAGDLLVPRGGQDVLDVGGWVCRQVRDQLAGRPGAAWTGGDGGSATASRPTDRR